MQINTTVSRHNVADLDKIIELLISLRVVLWSVFFLVPTGRAQLSDLLSAEEHEQVFAKTLRHLKRGEVSHQDYRRPALPPLPVTAKSPRSALPS